MMHLSQCLRLYLRGTKAGAVEFALIFPFLFLSMIFILDIGNLFADRRVSYRLAESIVRAARAIDNPIVDANLVPLQEGQMEMLQNIAKRLLVQWPEGRNYVWIGRFVKPHGLASDDTLQLLPGGIKDIKTNRGSFLAGTIDSAPDVHEKILAEVEKFAVRGDIVYAVEIGFTRRFLTPLPTRLKQQLSKVRYIL